LLPDQLSIQENVLLFKHYANTNVEDLFYFADFAETAESSAPLPHVPQNGDDEEPDVDAPLWQRVSEAEVPQDVIDTIKFLPDTYSMQIDADIPANAASSVETNLAYGLDANQTSLASNTKIAWDPKKKSFAVSISDGPYAVGRTAFCITVNLTSIRNLDLVRYSGTTLPDPPHPSWSVSRRF
jgi:hypothetical protein